MIHNKIVHGNQELKPPTIEINNSVVYIRSNIEKEIYCGPGGKKYEQWVYIEDQLDRSEYDQLSALTLDIPDDAWNAGLQEACREARYRRWDGPEQSARRRIELGIDVEQNRAKLDKILAYKQAVYETTNQPGYPNNVPVWPPEPTV